MAKMSLKDWINSNQKAKGLSTKEAKAGASKYKSISAAKKAGSLYYTNKDGQVMIAATAEDLKSPAPSKSLRPKKRPTSGGSRPAATAKETAEVAAANKAIKLQIAARKDTGPNAARKKPMAKKKEPSASASRKESDNKKAPVLKGAAWMSAHTSAEYHALTKSEASALGLPRSRLAGMQSRFKNNKFKDGQGWGYKTP